MFTTTKQPLGPTVLRFAGSVQSLVAIPCMLYLAGRAYMYWSHPYDVWFYFTYASPFSLPTTIFITQRSR